MSQKATALFRILFSSASLHPATGVTPGGATTGLQMDAVAYPIFSGLHSQIASMVVPSVSKVSAGVNADVRHRPWPIKWRQRIRIGHQELSCKSSLKQSENQQTVGQCSDLKSEETRQDEEGRKHRHSSAFKIKLERTLHNTEYRVTQVCSNLDAKLDSFASKCCFLPDKHDFVTLTQELILE